MTVLSRGANLFAVADPEKNLGGAEKHAITTCSSIKTPHKREI